MSVTYEQKLFLSFASLLLLIIILIFTELHKFFLVIAVFLLFYNLKIIFSLVTSYEPSESIKIVKPCSQAKVQGNQTAQLDVRAFEERVKLAFQKNANKKSGYFEEENKYWNNRFFCKSEKIEELKELKLTDLRRDRVARNDEELNFKLEMSTIKKIRNYLQNKEPEDSSNYSKIREHLCSKVKILAASLDKVSGQDDPQIKRCITVIEEYITSKISNDYDNMVNDFNAVQKFLQRCFSLSLSLQSTASNSAITYAQLMEMVELIEKKSLIPPKYTANLSPFQVKKELALVRGKINKLPDFTLPANILRLSLFLHYLKKQFEQQNIIFSSFYSQGKLKEQDKNHLFKFTESNRLYYHKVSHIKSKSAATPVLLFLICVWDKYHRSNKGVIKQIKYALNL